MLKISTKLTLWYLFATAAVIIITALTMYYIYENQRRTSIDEDLSDFAEFLTTGLGAQSTDLSDIFNEMLARKEKPSTKQRTHNRFVLSSNDSIIFESNLATNLDSLLNALEERKEFSFKSMYNTVTLNNTEYRVYTRPIKLKPKKDFQLLVFTSMERLYESLLQLRTIIFIVVPISLFVSGFIGFFIARRAFAPVRAIIDTASSISSQNLELRVPISKTDDELSKLANTINDMIGRLYDTFKSQQRFVADASHDLRTPLTVIQMELELLMTETELSESTKAILDRCLKEVFRLNELADNLMLLARADARQLKLNKKMFRFDEQLLECITQLKNLAQNKDISFRLNIEDSIDFFADESMTRRMLINALDNAIKYSDSGNIISIDLLPKEMNFELIIQNFGSPIPHESLVNIFNRFQRGDKSRTSKGFGLGMAIIRAVVSAHDGIVTLDSNIENGTTLKISFPLNSHSQQT